MALKGRLAIPILVLRIVTLLALVASGLLLVTNNYKLTVGEKTSFKDIFVVYRYVLATAVIGVAYTLLQLPLAIYYACTEKRLIRGSLLPEFDMYADNVINVVIASGVGAGFAIGFEFKHIIPALFELIEFLISRIEFFGLLNFDEDEKRAKQFFDRGNIATAVLLVGSVSMVFVSLLSSINRTN